MRAGHPSLLMSGVALAALFASAAPAAAEARVFRAHADHVLGTSFDMAVSARSQVEAELAFGAARAEIARLDKVLSAWRTDSELSRLNTAAHAQVSPDLFAVLSACEAWRARSGGAFDARLGAIEQQWGTVPEARPTTEALCEVSLAAQGADVGLDPVSQTVSRPDAVVFAPDGLAKGHVIDAAMAAARRAAPCARGMMLNIGGDLACWGDEGADGQGWTAAVADPANLADNAAPATLLRVSNGALAVSGPGQRDRMVDGVAYSHLIDPRTGEPAPRQQAAVLAHTAADADALSTALAVMPADDALALAERLDGYEATIFAADGRRLETTGWNALTQAIDTAAQCQAAAPLPAGFAVEVEFNLPKLDVSNYKRPYVVAWVTDANKALVKTLLILGDKPDWLEDNYVWYRRYGRKSPGVIEATAKPTRAPGRYTVGWDGTDAKGARVPQGRYTINVEAAREHGGHAYQSIDVDLGAGPVTGSAAGKDELGAASAKYLKRK